MSARCSACGQVLPRDLDTIIAEFQQRYPRPAPDPALPLGPAPEEA